MATGETTVGGIVGFLRMDDEQFNRTLDEAMAKVKLLDGMDADVHVRATGADSVTRSMRTATHGVDSVTAASRRLEDATGRVRVAQLRLDEARNSGRSRPSTIVAAEHSLTRALRDENDAIWDTYAGNIRLGESNDRLERSARRATRGVSGMDGSLRRLRLQDPRVILGAIAVAVAALGPVAGATTAAVAGLTGVVGAGVLAWRGYQEEIRQGTALGQAMQGELSRLNNTVTALGGTTARAMAPGLLSSLRKLDGFLPSVNGSVSVLGKDLGHAFDLTADGVISGLRNMMPLLEDGGRGAENLAQKFADFTASQDFKDFIAYARRELPQMADALGSLIKGVVDLGVALAPAGDGIVAFIDQVGHAFSLVSKGIGPVMDAVEWLATHGGPKVDGLGKHTKAVEDDQKATAEHTQTAQAAVPVLTGQTTAVTNLANAYGTAVPTLQAAEEAQRKQADAAAAATALMQQENDAAGLLKQSLDLLNGEAITAASAQNTFDSSLANMGTHIDKTGKEIHFTTTSIKNMSAASVALRGQLIGQVQNAEALIEANGGLTDSTGKVTEQAKKLRKQIIDNAVAHGVDRKAAQAFIDTIFKFPKKVPPTKLDVDKAEAQRKVKEFQKAIDQATTPHDVFIATRGVVPAKVRVMELRDAIESLRNKTVTVTVRGVMNKLAANPALASSDGNIFRSYAGGGFENHMAQIAPAGAMRLWAEPETGGEAYIPLAPSKRARSVAIWQETGRMLGQENGAPVVYVQNPWGPEYMRAQTASVADGRIASYDRQQSRAVRAGVGRR